MTDVLVLDATWLPIGRVAWQRAMTLLYEEKARTVEEHPERVIRSPSQAWKAPSVIQYVQMVGKWKRGIKFSRQNIWLRDKGRCQFCGRSVAFDEFTYDHVTPRGQGGATRWENIVTACVPCNLKKGPRTPEQAGMHLRSTPVRPKTLPATNGRMFWKRGMPESWKAYMMSAAYWRAELDHEE